MRSVQTTHRLLDSSSNSFRTSSSSVSSSNSSKFSRHALSDVLDSGQESVYTAQSVLP